MAKGFKPVDRDQVFLLPPDMRDWLPEEHLVWFLLDVVDSFDITAFQRGYRLGGVGREAFDPAMMIALPTCAYCGGVRSFPSDRAGVSHRCGVPGRVCPAVP